MKNDYYYLIASFPSAENVDIQELYDHILVNLSQEDAQLFRFFGYVHDNYNLISVLAESHKNMKMSGLILPCNLSLAELQDENRLAQCAPSYIQLFLQELKGSFDSTPIREWEISLWGYFYEAINQTEDSFLIHYFQHENALADTLRFTISQEFYPKSDTAALTPTFQDNSERWKQALQQLLRERNLDRIADWIRDHRLEITEGLCSNTTFDRNRVFHHFLHIQRQYFKLGRRNTDYKADYQHVRSRVLSSHAQLQKLLP